MATITPDQAGNLVEDMYVLRPILTPPPLSITIPPFSVLVNVHYRLQREHLEDMARVRNNMSIGK